MFQTMASTEPDISLETVCAAGETVCAAGETVCAAGETVCAAGETVCKETSPDSKCPICLDRFRNVSYADRCFHRFCFRCILEWGRNKAECPLCKQPFSSVYHSVRSEDDFKLYELRPSENGSFGSVQGQRFRYRTTRTHRRRREGRTRGSPHQQEVMRFRRWLYRHGVRVRGVRDSGRSRDTSAEFFRKNPACLHRLVPWLKRELAVLYGSHDSVADVVLHVILSLITRQNMQNEAFLRELRPFLSSRAEHFLHEFLSFAKSPFNMEAYDQHALYDCPAPSHVSAVSEDDIDLSSAPPPWDDETPGPSYSSSTQSVFTISDSDVDSASEEEEGAVIVNANTTANISISNTRVDEGDHSSDGDCVIIGFIKPTTQRTPELVQLSSDSEASLYEEPEPSTSNQSDTRDLTNQRRRNTDHNPSHSTTPHNSKSKHRDRDYSTHQQRRRSYSHSHKDRRNKATNQSPPSHTCSHKHHTHRDPRHSRHLPQRSPFKTHSHSKSRTRLFSRSGARAPSRSRTRARSQSRTRARSPSSTRARSRSRTCARSRSRTRARSRSSTRARSRTRTRACSRSRTRARSRSRSRTHSCSRHWRMQASLQNSSEHLSVSPSPSPHRRSSHDKPCGKQKHKSLHAESRRRSREKHHHSKKKKKKTRRRSSSMEDGTERRRHHKKKKKHKTARKNRGERMGWSSSASSHALIHTQSAAEATPSRAAAESTPPRAAAEATPLKDAATTNPKPRSSSPTCANITARNRTASHCAFNKTLSNHSVTGSSSSHAPLNTTPSENPPQTGEASNTDRAPPQCNEALLL